MILALAVPPSATASASDCSKVTTCAWKPGVFSFVMLFAMTCWRSWIASNAKLSTLIASTASAIGHLAIRTRKPSLAYAAGDPCPTAATYDAIVPDLANSVSTASQGAVAGPGWAESHRFDWVLPAETAGKSLSRAGSIASADRRPWAQL